MARGGRRRWYHPDTPKDPDSATRARDRLIKKQKQARDRYRGNRQEMDVPHSQREIIDRPVSNFGDVVRRSRKPRRGAGTAKAVVAAGKASTYPSKQVKKAASKAGGMMKKAGSWAKHQGFVPTIR